VLRGNTLDPTAGSTASTPHKSLTPYTDLHENQDKQTILDRDKTILEISYG